TLVEADRHVDGPLLVGGRDDADLRRRNDHHALGLLAAEAHLGLRLAGDEAAADDRDFLAAGRRALRRLDAVDLEGTARLLTGRDEHTENDGDGESQGTLHRGVPPMEEATIALTSVGVKACNCARLGATATRSRAWPSPGASCRAPAPGAGARARATGG